MKLISKFLALSVAALFLLSGTATVLADNGHTHNGMDHAPMVGNDGNKIVVSNSHMTVWFEGMKPNLHVFLKGQNGNVTGFTVDIKGVYEINKTNVPVAVLSTERAFPEEAIGMGMFNYNTSVSVQNDSAAQMVNITFNLTANEFTMKNSMNENSHDSTWQPTSFSPGNASIAIVFHVNETTSHVKFDLLVHKWSWANNTADRLALITSLESHNSMKTPDGQTPTHSGAEVSGNSVDVSSSPFSSQGYISWGQNANATYSNGNKVELSVSALMMNNGENNSNDAHLWLIFNPPSGAATNYTSLVYDPVVGIQSSLTTFSYGLIGAAIAAVAVVGAVIVAKRRR
ncbi:MAG: hypothetical protein PXX82_06885 [Methanomassiliicoccales archaeon]|nr:hypothetical protein [Methanomassiliicoccales archaeon]